MENSKTRKSEALEFWNFGISDFGSPKAKYQKMARKVLKPGSLKV